MASKHSPSKCAWPEGQAGFYLDISKGRHHLTPVCPLGWAGSPSRRAGSNRGDPMTENKHPRKHIDRRHDRSEPHRRVLDSVAPQSPSGVSWTPFPQPRGLGAKCAAEWTFRCLMIGGGMFKVGHPWCKSAGSDILASGQGPKYRSRYDSGIGTLASNYPESALVRCRVSM